jgi:hypothetical protein
MYIKDFHNIKEIINYILNIIMFLIKRVLINYHYLYQYSTSTSMQNQFITGLKLKNSLTNNLV